MSQHRSPTRTEPETVDESGASDSDARLRRLRARSVTALVVAVLGVAVAVAVPLIWLSVRPTSTIAQIGAGTAASLGSSASPSSGDVGALRAGVIPAGPTTAPIPAQSAQPLTPPSPPTRLSIPALGISAPVVPVGVQLNNELAVPANISQVGWYRYGAAPGSLFGSIVISGHVDSAQQGLGAFWTLRNAVAGTVISVTAQDGRQLRYAVTAREEFHKTAVPLGQIFASTGPGRLTLVTCGGAFSATIRSYEDNIVVTALPVT